MTQNFIGSLDHTIGQIDAVRLAVGGSPHMSQTEALKLAIECFDKILPLARQGERGAENTSGARPATPEQPLSDIEFVERLAAAVRFVTETREQEYYPVYTPNLLRLLSLASKGAAAAGALKTWIEGIEGIEEGDANTSVGDTSPPPPSS